MKKKAIEKIPYLPIRGDQKARYIAVTAVKVVSHEKNLIIDVYDREANTRAPKARIAISKKDYGTYWPEDDKWNRTRIMEDYGSMHNLIWKSANFQPHDEIIKQNALDLKDDLTRIEKFCKNKITKWNNWWDLIYSFQEEMDCRQRRKREHARYEKRMKALNERAKNIKKSPEKEILTFADKVGFSASHILFYKRNGSSARIACTACGGVSKVKIRRPDNYEAQFEKVYKVPEQGMLGVCPLCGKQGRFICQGKAKKPVRQSVIVYLGQKYKENEIVIRAYEVGKEWQYEAKKTNHGPELFNAQEELNGLEICRAYFFADGTVQKDYKKYSLVDGCEYWDDCNLYGMHNIILKEGMIMPETFENIKGTILQYSALEEWYANKRRVSPVHYIQAYREIPQIEMLVKLKLFHVVEWLMNNRMIDVDITAKNLADFLKIYKKDTKIIMDHDEIRILEVLQVEKILEANWTEEQVLNLSELYITKNGLEETLSYISARQFLNAIKKYAQMDFDNNHGSGSKLRHVAQEYRDYLRMRIEQGYDLRNKIYLRPRDLERAHAEMVLESHRTALDKRKKEVEIKYPDIANRFKFLNKKYGYEIQGFIIRPASSAAEIVEEGRILHHCVGGNNYLGSHNRGDTYILLMRRKEKADLPYITIEINGKSNKIIQWYGAYDKKPEREQIEGLLEEYIKHLKGVNDAIFTDDIRRLA